MEKRELQEKVTALMKYLLDLEQYKQVKIANELKAVGCIISPSSVSNIKNNLERIGSSTLLNAAKGLDRIFERNFCLQYNQKQEKIEAIPDCILDKITDAEIDLTEVAERTATYIIHKGRVLIPQKVEHYRRATKEIIEIGIRLRKFNDYFVGQREEFFINPIYEKLSVGVDFKCYVAEPERAKAYIQKMSAGIKKFEEAIDNIPSIYAGLKEKFLEINELNNYSGKMRLYQYNSPPIFYASVIDPQLDHGKMFISPYLYGVARANCPVIEIPKIGNRQLFNRYWKSIKAIIEPTAISKKKVIDLLK